MTRIFDSKRSVRCAVLALLAAVTWADRPLHAHHPDKENAPVWQYLDVIPPLGNRLPPGYRRQYNRPPYLQGRLMYHIAPSSQEAMAWHRSVHADSYRKPKKCFRLEQHFFYPKPWEVLQIGPRKGEAESAAPYADAGTQEGQMPQLLPPESAYQSDIDDAVPSLEEVSPDPEPASPLDLPRLELEDLRGEVRSPSDLHPEALLEPVGFTDLDAAPASRAVERPTTSLGTQLRKSLLANELIDNDRENNRVSRVTRSRISPDSPFLKRVTQQPESAANH